MRVRALAVVLLAAGAFLALYAIGRADDDGGAGTDLVTPAAIGEDMRETPAPPELERDGPLPSLKPAGGRAAAPASGPPASVPSPAPAAPAPAPTPTPAPTAPSPPPAPPSDGGQPFYDDG